jgi:NifU-like protein involved in Fe-S cluster formation
MSADPYSPTVRALFGDPAHAGSIEDAQNVEIDDQGLRIRLFALSEEGSITRLGFLAWGCPHVIAAAEAFCREFEGRNSAELLDFSSSGLMQSLSVPVEKTGRILVLEDAVRSLGNILRGSLTNRED